MEDIEIFSAGRKRRELFYSIRRKTAQEIARNNLVNALKLKGFKDSFDRWNAIPYELARAEYYEKDEIVEKLKAEQAECFSKMSKILKSVDLSIDDLQPRVICKACCDTGRKADGSLCDCFESF